MFERGEKPNGILLLITVGKVTDPADGVRVTGLN
jgi:hypothetical protein